ncbi:hypothetical protein LIER_21274 [Lithospermum erythrorhizon]|uniref:Uncharacterized protein n=1 Tax=Lithospermum erythrorhizon TaxID=34254 RepID=A0AAV3QS42_LITER
MNLSFNSSDPTLWKEALASYAARIESLKPELTPLDTFYTSALPGLLKARSPKPHITQPELSQIMQWKLKRGKWRPRLMKLVESLKDEEVKEASKKAMKAMPDVGQAVRELSVLKGVGPATASAVLAAYAPNVVPFMSDEAMEASIGNSKDYTLKQYLVFLEKLQEKAKELTEAGELFTPSDVERALWSAAVGAKQKVSPQKSDEVKLATKSKRKRKS